MICNNQQHIIDSFHRCGTASVNMNLRIRRIVDNGVDKQLEDSSDEHKSNVHYWRSPQRLKVSGIVCLVFLAVLSITNIKHSTPIKPILVSYSPPTNVTNKLLATFESDISSSKLTPKEHNYEDYVPLILQNGKVLCRGSHVPIISKQRINWYIAMLAEGLKMNLYKDGKKPLPIILLDSDNSGCRDTQSRIDYSAIPRLTWYTPAPKYGTEWCKSTAMPGYEAWSSFGSYKARTWDKTFRKDEGRRGWSTKIDKAVWRGSTTGPKPNYVSFDKLPRAQLVKISMDRPDLFDVGFTSFLQGWEKIQNEVMNQTKITETMPFLDQMKYRAIIDIDGNAWSSRFTRLLCTNSVVIKVDPDYIEPFYTYVKPMVHYVPASLENITEVAEYVLDERNRQEMKSIVEAANEWCKKENNREQLPRNAISQLKLYEQSLYDEYNNSWVDEWQHVWSRISKNVGADLVDCSTEIAKYKATHTS